MKKITFITIGILLWQAIFASGNWTKIDNTKLPDTKINLLSSSEEVSVVQFNVNAYKLHIVMTPRGKAYTVSIPDGSPLQIKGAPNLPKLSTSLIIPNGKQMKVEVQYSDYIEINNIAIAPSKGVITRNINPLTISYTYGEVYNVNTFFPGDLANLNKPYIIRNYRGASIWVKPVRYNPVTKTLRIYKTITVKVSPTGNPAQINPLLETRGRHTTTPEFQDFYKHNFLNYSTFQSRYTPIDEGHPGRMLIISYGSFMTDMQPFVDWKNQKGIFTEMVDVSTIGNASAIKTYVQDYYNNHSDFCYLLLVGDATQVPSSYSTNASGDSDNDYGYVAGSDHRIDIFVGRFSAETTADVTTQVDRTIHYEKDVTSAESWMQYGLCVASDQGPGDDNEYDSEHEDNIKADYLAYGYISVETVYESTGPTATDISNAINTHCGVASYTGHGDVTMWYSVDPGGYTNSHVNALTNENELPFIFSVACVIGDFTTNTCFSEAWQRATNNGNPTGAIANIGSTINQSWNSPMDAQDEMVDILVESYTNNIKRTFGGISANGWGMMIDDYGTDGENMADTWTVFGDASVMIRTKQPQDMTITHATNINVGATLFDVNCDVEGALVSITKDNIILGTGYISSGTVSVSLSPAISGTGNILVTVTAYNKVTYQQVVPITSSNTLTASFSGTPLSIPVGGTVTFTDASYSPTSITSWNWKFDVTGVGSPAPTPATANTQGPQTVTYNSPGLYTVRLTVTDGSGADSLTRTDYVEVTATTLTANFSGTPLSIPAGSTVDFTDLTSGGTPTSWDWNFDVTGVGSPAPTPVTSTNQNPTGITFNSPGLYTISLTASDGTETDSETKTDYIEVIDPNQLQIDFTGTPTTIIQGQTVDFTSTATNGGPATSWNWTFNGAVTTTSTLENPSGIQYNTPGTYSVYLEASDGTYTDTLTKVGYITVLDSTNATDADFIANFTTIIAGGSVDFTNLSTGVIDSVLWTFDGVTPATSTLSDPTGIVYNTVGDYDVTLIVYSSLGNDTAFKPAYIHVIDPSQMDTVYVDFQATTARLIVQGNTVNFEDLSSGYPTSFDWTFQGGTPGSSTDQHPQGILYSTPGIYDVTLAASNSVDGDILTKTNYIVVTSQQWPDPNGFCDTISNVQPNEIPLTFRHLTTGGQWGYFPGHNSLNITAYADRFVNYTFSGIRAIIVPVVKAAANSSGAKVRFSVWGEDSLGNVINTPLGYQDFPISSFTPYMFTAIEFDNPISVSEKFYVGYQIYYGSPQDTFVVYMGPDRGQGGLNTLYCKKGGWKTASLALNDSINTSLGIKIVGCLVGNETIDLNKVVTVYPNPAHDIVMVDFNDLYAADATMEVFDMLGKKINVKMVTDINKAFIDMNDKKSGIYFVRISMGNNSITKKISLIK